MRALLFALLALTVWSCNSSNQDFTEKYKAEIRDTEEAFAAMTMEKSIPEAFISFAADSAILMRDDSLIKGKHALAEYYNSQNLEGVTLEWNVDFVDVSSSGDLGYTYGKYNLSIPDTTGGTAHYTGIFHTIWKKQKDGAWKFVWD